jgi:hypothetical protein
MAATTTTSFPLAVSASTARTLQSGLKRRRSISPQAGRGLEILGHAIEYLTDEFVHEGGSFTSDNGQLQAVQLLMAVNRQIYFECPEVPSFRDRVASLLGLSAN